MMHLCDLDEHSLARVFELIEPLQRCTSLPLVCKSFYQTLRASGLLYHHMVVEASENPWQCEDVFKALAFLDWAQPRLGHVRELILLLPDMRVQCLQGPLLSPCCHLRSLDLRTAGRLDSFLDSLPHLVSLRTLSLTAIGTVTRLPYWTSQLEELNLRLDLQGGRTFVKSYLSHLGPVHTLRISGPQYCDVHALLEGFYPQSLGGAVRFACAMHGPRAAGVKGHTTLASLQRKCLRTLELTHGNLSNVPSTIEVMATLRQLSLRNNQLSRLPIGRGVFPPLLQHLDLSMNKLRRLPRPLVGCFWLRTLLLALNDELEVHSYTDSGGALQPHYHEPNTVSLMQLTENLQHLQLLDLRKSLDAHWSQDSHKQIDRLREKLNFRSSRRNCLELLV